MNKKGLFFILTLFALGFILILAKFLLERRIVSRIQLFPRFEKIASQSGFSAAILEAQKKAEEEKKKEEEAGKIEEERKRQEEETKKYIAQFGPCRSIPILMYHHIDDKPGWLYIRKETFVKQMDYLIQKGYSTVTLTDVVENLNSGKALPAKPVVLTFDDGYRDVFENAYPVLRERSFKATFFLVTQLLGGGEYMTWDQVREIAGNPLATIGDHTLSHKVIPKETEERIKDEIVSAKNILEGNLGIKVNVFAYPYGSANGQSENILKSEGFAAAVVTHRGLACAKLPYELPRIRIGNAPLSSYGL